MISGTPLIGRDREVAELERRLSSARLVTITGAGGCGKTRLALEVADRVQTGTPAIESIVVEVATVTSADQLIDELLRALGARERFGRRPAQVLIESMARRSLLLVLDNCEHLLPATERVVAEVLGGTSAVTVLLTSREPLGTDRERAFRLAPLSLPEPGGGVGAVVRSAAGRLFIDRAAAVDPAFALTPSVARAVARICHELDGLPLALCLAAARMDTLTATEVAEALVRRGRLDAPAGEEPLSHHRSVRASLDWSYRMLDTQERRLLRRLSVFAGGFTEPGARAVAILDHDDGEVPAVLDSLVTKGLIAPVPNARTERWVFLETVREYASEQLVLEGEYRVIADRHLAFFREFAADADELLLEAGHELIDEETANLRRALEHAVEHHAPAALRIVASLMRHWVLGEHFEEARAASAAVLSLSPENEEPARAVVHCGAGLVGVLGEDYAAAFANTQIGLALAEGVDDSGAQARCQLLSAQVLIQTGMDIESGRRNAHRAVELGRDCGDSLGLAYALVNVAMVETICDRFDAAQTAYEEFLTIRNASEHVRLRTWAELAMAWAEVIAGAPERALAHADLSLALEGEVPSMTHFQAVGFRIHALALLGRIEEALTEGTRELSWAKEASALQAIPALNVAMMIAELVRGELDAADQLATLLLEVPQLHTLAIVHETRGRIALARRDLRGAEAQVAELRAVAAQTGSLRHRALADWIAGCAALLERDIDRGRELLHASLETAAELGVEREAADGLVALGLLAAYSGDSTRAARLTGAASMERSRLGCAALGLTVEWIQEARSRSVERDGGAVWNAAWAEGERLSLADAIAYARRGRGRRDRPSSGWESLTPAELEVAALASSGLSNPQIASRLFVSRATVKMHLSSIYTKLGIGNRTELATATAMRSVATVHPAKDWPGG